MPRTVSEVLYLLAGALFLTYITTAEQVLKDAVGAEEDVFSSTIGYDDTNSTEVEDNGFLSSAGFVDTNSTAGFGESDGNDTICVRRDFEGSVSAVYFPPPGPVDNLLLVFNSTYDNPREGMLFDQDTLEGLQLTNETTVDCDDYYEIAVPQLSVGALASLTG